MLDHLTLLQQCADRGDLEGVRALIASGVVIDELDVPVADEDLALISDEPRRFVVHSRVGTEYEGYPATSNGITALMIAIVRGHWEIARLLVASGANPNLPRDPADGGWRAIHLAARHGEIAFLEALGARLDDHAILGVRNEAIRWGRVDVLRWLVARTRIDGWYDGRTHLMEAIAAGATAIATLLRELGAREPSCPYCRSTRTKCRWAIPPDGGIFGWFCDACGRNC